MRGGLPLYCDVTVVSPLDGNGRPHSRCASVDGAALVDRAAVKATTYADVVSSRRACFVVLGVEVFGRFSSDVRGLLSDLALEKVATVPEPVRRSCQLAWLSRWWCLLSVSAAKSCAGCILLSDMPSRLDSDAAPAPHLADVLGIGP